MKPEKKSKNDPAQGMRDVMKKATTEIHQIHQHDELPQHKG